MIELSAENLQLPLICHCCAADNAPAIFTAVATPLEPTKGVCLPGSPISWRKDILKISYSL